MEVSRKRPAEAMQDQYGEQLAEIGIQDKQLAVGTSD